MLTNIVIILISSGVVHLLLQRDLAKGLAAAIFFLVLLPLEVRIDMPGAIPQLTAHRVILLIVLFNVWPRIRRLSLAPVSRIVLLLCLTGVARLLSCVTAIDSGDSFKDMAGLRNFSGRKL
jgi:hypothetical protein